jgi:hypothetical protein
MYIIAYQDRLLIRKKPSFIVIVVIIIIIFHALHQHYKADFPSYCKITSIKSLLASVGQHHGEKGMNLCDSASLYIVARIT